MHPLTISKGTILLIFLCCHLQISSGTGTIGQKVGEKVVATGIIGGISKTAQKALIYTFSPFYKFFVEGGLGLVTRYFTLSDYWGIGHTVRKGAVHTATLADKAFTVVKKGIKKYTQKRMEEQMEEMNRWWTRKQLDTVSSVASGIGGGISWAVSSSVIDKISSAATSLTGDNAPVIDTSGNTDTTATPASTPAPTPAPTTETNHYGVSISKPVSLHQLALLGHKPADTDSTSQVIIGKPVGEQTGEADTSSTVAIWKDPFGFLFGETVIEEEPSDDQGLFGMLFGGTEESSHGCPTCGKEEEGINLNEQQMNVLKGKRTIRSVSDTDSLVRVFQSLERDDPQHCLPMVLCAIHADPQGTRSPQEENLVTVFRPLVIQRHIPVWAGPWVQGARQGKAAAAQGKAEEPHTTCEKAFPKCPFSPHQLRTLMAKTLWGADSHKSEHGTDINLKTNIL